MDFASYNAVPYPHVCYTQTHPDRLATIATLFGLSPRPIEQCRVLELGCASGGNLLPMAMTLPDATFVGIDYAQRQIDEAQAIVDDLSLPNIQFLQQNILEDTSGLGQFDYIIAHGVYSWTPPAVRERLLEICQQQLTAHGVAFISYNTLPGWHRLLALREMMQYRTRHIESPLERAAMARDFVHQLAEVVPDDQPYSYFLRSYDQMLGRRGDQEDTAAAFLLHDELETINQPVYFHQFVEHAACYQLQYLADADFPSIMLGNVSPAAAEHVMQMADNDLIALEQHLDFVRNRTLRQTLICHADAPVVRRLEVNGQAFFNIKVVSKARLASDELCLDNGVTHFEAVSGAKLSTSHPVSKAALAHLIARSPEALSVLDLFSAACTAVYGDAGPPNPSADAQQLISTLLQGFTYDLNLIELHNYLPLYRVMPTERPMATRLARYQAAQNYRYVTNLRHERVQLDPLGRIVLPLLDGTRTLEEINRYLSHTIVQNKEQPIDINIDTIGQVITWLARSALLR